MHLLKNVKPGLRKNSHRRTLLKIESNGYSVEWSYGNLPFETFHLSGIQQKSKACLAKDSHTLAILAIQKKMKLVHQTDHYRFFSKACKDKLKMVRFIIWEYDYHNQFSDGNIFMQGLQKG